MPQTRALRSAATASPAREKLIRTAERLFSERGIDSVSVAEINLAAGQRNKTAAQYHFGDKTGLLRAVLDKHLPELMRQRDERLQALDRSTGWTVQGVVRALLEPLASKLTDPDGGREFLRISAQLASSYTQALEGVHVELFPSGLFDPIRKARDAFLTHLPPTVAAQRVSLAISMMLHGLAEHSRDKRRNTPLFLRNLEDCLVAMCNAPMSAGTREAL
jgi:AcrR family transcriptional regulator